MRTGRVDVALHGLEVLGAGLFGWLITEPNLRPYAIAAAVIVSGSLLVQFQSAASRFEADVEVRLASLLALLQLPGDARATYHTPRRWRTGYKQAVDYVPHGSGRGRRFQDGEGVVGQCIHRKQQLFVNFVSEQDFNERMTDEFGFDAQEKSRRTQNRRSYMAHPVIGHRERVVGVVYIDTDAANALPPKTKPNALDLVDRLAGEIVKISGPRVGR